MNEGNRIAAHYSGSGMAERVPSALTGEGMDIDVLSWDRLTSFDQFHTRGLAATRVRQHLPPEPGEKVIDIGGVGGPGEALGGGVPLRGNRHRPDAGLYRSGGYADRTLRFVRSGALSRADALDLPFCDGLFDIGWSQNVSMNVAEKTDFYAEIARVQTRRAVRGV